MTHVLDIKCRRNLYFIYINQLCDRVDPSKGGLYRLCVSIFYRLIRCDFFNGF